MHVYNTQTRKRELFQPLHDKNVTMYVCGPTVYNYIHIGNARAFLFFDVVRRYLKYQGYHVTYVQNFTDVDDRLIEAAQKEDTTVKELAERYIQAYFEDMDALGVQRADHHPKATEHIDEMVEGIQTLIEKGYAYEQDGDVYFRSQSKEDYGKLSHQSMEELKSGARVEVNEKKENPLDFALWKKAKPTRSAGTALGEKVVPDGTLNAPLCPGNILVIRWISMPGEWTFAFPTTKMKLPKARLGQENALSAIGFTTGMSIWAVKRCRNRWGMLCVWWISVKSILRLLFVIFCCQPITETPLPSAMKPSVKWKEI